MNNIIIIGIGGTGAILTERLFSENNCHAIAIDTDKKSLDKRLVDEKILLAPKECRGSSAFSVIRGRLAAEESYYQLKSLLAGIRSVIVVTGLGGGTGSGAVPIMAEIAKNAGLEIVVFATMPFSVESDRCNTAKSALATLQSMNIPTVVHDIAERENTDKSLTEFIDMIDNAVIEGVTALINKFESTKSILSREGS